jgi:hypothetical protein
MLCMHLTLWFSPELLLLVRKPKEKRTSSIYLSWRDREGRTMESRSIEAFIGRRGKKHQALDLEISARTSAK